jgi:hypothetical protein
VVRTDGPDDKHADYDVKYTFGTAPLQQYLIEFPDGRLQALSIAWDTRHGHVRSPAGSSRGRGTVAGLRPIDDFGRRRRFGRPIRRAAGRLANMLIRTVRVTEGTARSNGSRQEKAAAARPATGQMLEYR